jgi:hypothetical protein
MERHDFVPYRDNDFLQWVHNFVDYLAPKAAQFNFPQEVISNIQSQMADFEKKLRIVDDPGTHTPVATQAKKTAKKLLEKTMRNAVGEYLTRNHLVSDDDRIAMGLPIHKTTHTSSPIAHDAPGVDADTSILGRISIHFFEKEHRHKKAKPAGQIGVEIVWVIRDTPPTRWDELLHSAMSTRTPYTFSFENDQRGQTFYFAIRWENTRGEKGPWSAIQNVIIP